MIDDLGTWERCVFSQNGEDGILEGIFHELGYVDDSGATFVEIGAENGKECNCRNLLENHCWQGIMIECQEKFLRPMLHKNKASFLNVQPHFITKDNVDTILKGLYRIPRHFDLLTIDIDGVDFWIIKAILESKLEDGFLPKVILVEYNSQLGPDVSKTVAYEENFVWDWTQWYGASLMAWVKMLGEKGYTLVYCEDEGINAFFIRNDFVKGHFAVKPPKELFNKFKKGLHDGFPTEKKTESRRWIEI